MVQDKPRSLLERQRNATDEAPILIPVTEYLEFAACRLKPPGVVENGSMRRNGNESVPLLELFGRESGYSQIFRLGFRESPDFARCLNTIR